MYRSDLDSFKDDTLLLIGIAFMCISSILVREGGIVNIFMAALCLVIGIWEFEQAAIRIYRIYTTAKTGVLRIGIITTLYALDEGFNMYRMIYFDEDANKVFKYLIKISPEYSVKYGSWVEFVDHRYSLRDNSHKRIPIASFKPIPINEDTYIPNMDKLLIKLIDSNNVTDFVKYADKVNSGAMTTVK